MTPGTRHLLDRLLAVQWRIEALLTQRRAGDSNPEDPFRGLYVDEAMIDLLLARDPGRAGDERGAADADSTDAEVGRLTDAELARLAEIERQADAAVAAGARLPLRELAEAFALDPLDVELLLVALAGEVDPRLEHIFGYLNDDVTRRRPTAALALTLCGRSVASAAARHRLQHGPLIEGGLLTLEEPERPLPGRCLRVPDRVVDQLLGSASPDIALRNLLLPPESITWGDPSAVTAALRAGERLIHLQEPRTGSGRLLAVAALTQTGCGALVLDATTLVQQPDPLGLAHLAVREALLTGAGLVVAEVDQLAGHPFVLRRLADSAARVLTVSHAPWDPAWSASSPLRLTVPECTAAERAALWRENLGPLADSRLPLAETIAPFRMPPERVAQAARTAASLAALAGALTPEHLRQGALAQNGSALARLARRITPAVGWEDLVLPPGVLASLQEVALRARHRERVLREWQMRPGGGRGTGVIALFSGDSGTGKTMSAEVVAGELGLELYVVNMATVVDKYIGETEKNLERVFTAATETDGILFFDEADAVFGKRTEVRDSHDRYANLEISYLLQRLETFTGLCILATNLRTNIDEAFTRRLDVVVDFPVPDQAHRLALWDRSLGRVLPRGPDLDLAFCAESFVLAGGAIRSAAITAAYLAVADGEVLAMRHLITAIHREYRKLGRLTLEHEFGRYWALVATG